MKTLWTPWRMEHILDHAPKAEGCIFDATSPASFDKARLQLYCDRYTIVLLNRFPYANGHLLVAPTRHIPCITDLTVEENGALMTMIQTSTSILKRSLSPDGFNIGCNLSSTAGAGIADHLHFHIVPRWNGDHNFITVLAEIRTIPEHISATFDRLLPHFQELSSIDKA